MGIRLAKRKRQPELQDERFGFVPLSRGTVQYRYVRLSLKKMIKSNCAKASPEKSNPVPCTPKKRGVLAGKHDSSSLDGFRCGILIAGMEVFYGSIINHLH